jgi:two-component system, response regulator
MVLDFRRWTPTIQFMAPPRVILVAEDNDDDFVLLRCAFESAGLPHRLIGATDGLDAINYLFADNPYTNRSAFPFPDLMLLDLQMPIVDGFEVLATVKGRTQFRCLPIVVLSSVDDPLIIQQALNLGATDFLIKPVTTDERIMMARGLHSRWLAGQERSVVNLRSFNPWAFPQPMSGAPESRTAQGDI